MNSGHKIIKNSEINDATFIEGIQKQKQLIYHDIKKRSLLCSLFHLKKEVFVPLNKIASKKFYCCDKCKTIWHYFSRK